MSIKKVKKFIKEHKKEIAITASVAAVIGIGIAVKKHSNTSVTIPNAERVPEPKALRDTFPKLNVMDEVMREFADKYGVDRIDEYSGAYEFMTGYIDSTGNYKVPLSALGEFGENIIKVLPGLNGDNTAYILINIAK
jgi:hypothetical protein